MNDKDNEEGMNPRTASAHVAANTRKILAFVDGGLTAADTSVIEEHLRSCRECQAFYQSARQLTAALEREIKRPVLSPSFTARLQERIEADRSLQSQTAYFQQKQRMQREFEQNSARLRKQLFCLPNLLDLVSYSFATLIACYLLVTGFGWLIRTVGQSSPAEQQHALLIFSGIIVIAGIAVALGLATKGQARPSLKEI